MRIFSKQQPGQVADVRSMMPSEGPAHLAGRGHARGTSPPLTSMDEARKRLGATADEARAEIESLVETERKQLETMMEEAVEAVESRLRGAAERRIDSEVKRVEEANNKLRRDLKRTIHGEVSRITKLSLSADRDEDHNRTVPIRARA